VWREFAYHLMHHTPRILTGNWKPDWDAFAWETDPDAAHAQAWMRGRTGIRFVDAALREMYVTGRMHNRGRMIVASYLTKHLLIHWKIGLKWFEDCLIDWDPASNAMGWQLDKFDPQRDYANRWIAEGKREPHPDALKYFDAIPKSWSISASDPYPLPIVAADVGRQRALDAYANRGF